ncbi:helix-turn-helix domain-containing protein [Streptomyces sp. CH-036]|uniref:helix-turn-helix domain-containing protein n=1 Tax=Streptomyces sp. CH-036 TaxID=3406733 RepID=UPI003C718D73
MTNKILRDWLPELMADPELRAITKSVGAHKLAFPGDETISDISNALRLNRSTVRKCLHELADEGWVERNRHGLWECPLGGTTV